MVLVKLIVGTLIIVLCDHMKKKFLTRKQNILNQISTNPPQTYEFVRGRRSLR
jgi:hypothetical protein